MPKNLFWPHSGGGGGPLTVQTHGVFTMAPAVSPQQVLYSKENLVLDPVGNNGESLVTMASIMMPVGAGASVANNFQSGLQVSTPAGVLPSSAGWASGINLDAIIRVWSLDALDSAELDTTVHLPLGGSGINTNWASGSFTVHSGTNLAFTGTDITTVAAKTYGASLTLDAYWS